MVCGGELRREFETYYNVCVIKNTNNMYTDSHVDISHLGRTMLEFVQQHNCPYILVRPTMVERRRAFTGFNLCVNSPGIKLLCNYRNYFHGFSSATV